MIRTTSRFPSVLFVLSLVTVLAAVGLWAGTAQADNATWSGNGTTDTSWTNLGNWVGPPAAVPGTGDTATFNNVGNVGTIIGVGGVTINTILFDTASAAAYTIGGGAVGSEILTLDNGGAVTVNSGVGFNQSFNSAIILGTDGNTAAFTLTDNSFVGGLTFVGNITGSAVAGTGVKTLAAAGAGSTAISGIIADGTGGGSVDVTKSGSGMLTLSNTNTYNGATTLNGGVLRATAAGALGAGNLSLAGGNLQLANNGATAFNRPTTVTGDTIITSDRTSAGGAQTHTLGTLSIGPYTLSVAKGAYVNSGTAGVTFGATTLTGAPTLNLGYGTLLTLGAIADNGNTVTLQGGGNLAQTGVWGAGVGGLTLDTTYRGTATLNQPNTFTGTVTIKNGILAANTNANALGVGAASLDLQGGILDLNNATGLLFYRNTTVNANSTIISERNVAGAGVTYALGALTMNGAYTLTVRGGNVNSGTAGVTFESPTFYGNVTFDTWNPTVGSSASPISGNVVVTFCYVTGNGYSLTKNGAGTLLSNIIGTGVTPFGDGNIIFNGGTMQIAPRAPGAYYGIGVNAAITSTFTYLSGTLQLTQNGTTGAGLDYTIGNAGAAADSVLVRATRGTMVLGVTALANLGGVAGTERFLVNGQTTASNKDGAASGSGIYDASLVAQEGAGNTGVGSFVVADTVINGGFRPATYTVATGGTGIPATTILDVTSSISIPTGSNPYALRVGPYTLTNVGTTTVNGGAFSAVNSGLGGVILNPTATASTITGGTLDFGLSEGVIYVGSGVGNGTIASQITGSAGLTKFGPGQLALTSATNSYTGGTVINGGTLWITNEAQLGTTAATITINGGGTLLLGDAGVDTSLAAGRNIVLGPGMQNIVKWSRRSASINGIISGSGSVNFGDNTAWNQDGGGGGRFQLNAANTYTGDTILTYTGIKDPGINVNNALALQYSTLDYNTTNIPNGINAGSMVRWGVANPIIGGLKGNRAWDMSYQTNPVTVRIGNNNQDTIFSGSISASNNPSTQLIKIGTGTLVLSGNNTYAGVTEVQNGTLVLSGANTGTGNTLITGGTLLVANNLALQNSAYDTLTTGGTLAFATGIDTPTFGGLIGSGNLTMPANITALTLNPQAAKTYSGILSSSSTTAGMNVTKIGGQVQVLSGANTYSGNTILTGSGAIRMGVDPVGAVGSITSSAIGTGGLVFNGGALGSDSTLPRTILNPVTFTGNATLGDATNNGKLTFSANVDLGTAFRTITTNSDAQFDGSLNGLAGITKAGTATLTLTGNNTYLSLTTVTAGKLVLSGNNVEATGWITINGGVAQFNSPASINGTARNVTINSPGTVVFDPLFGAGNIPAALTRITTGSTGAIAADNYAATDFDFNAASLTAASLGAIGNVTYTGLLTPQGTTGSLVYRLGGGGGTLTMANTNAIAGAGNALTVVGSNVILAAANNFTGATTINSGATLTLGTGVTGQNGSVGSTSIVDNGTLVINNFDNQAYSGIISGSGAVTKNGLGQLTLSAPQTYTGTTTVGGGTLVLGAGDHTLAVNKPMVVNTGGTLDIGGNKQYVGALSGSGGSIIGSGALTVNQASAQTFAGSIQGTVNLVKLANGAGKILTLTGDTTTTGSFSLIGGDIPQTQGPDYGGLTLKDGGRLSGATAITLNNGSLFIDNSGAANDNTRVNDSATVALNGGRIIYNGRASTASTESFGDVTADTGMGTITATAGGSGSAVLTLNSLTRNSGATLRLDGTNLGTAGNNSRILVTTGELNAGALGGNLTAVNGVIPGVFRGIAGSSNYPVGYVAGLGFAPVGTAGGFPTTYSGALASAAATDNVVNPSAYVVKTGGQTINSMVQGNNITFNSDADTLTIAAGMIGQGSEQGKLIGSDAGIRGKLTSGLATGELFLVKTNEGSGGTAGAFKINSVITDNGAPLSGGTRVKLVLDSYYRTNLTNQLFNLTANNTYTGGTVVSGANEVYLTATTAGWTTIPAANDPAQGLIVNNSVVTMQTNAQQIHQDNIVTLNGGATLTLVGANNTLAGLVFNSNGGTATPTVTGGTKMTITGNISSTPTNVAVTPTISVALDLGTTAHDITVAALPEGNFVNGANLVGLNINSVIQSTGGGFTKKGTGVLQLSQANTYTGDTNINAGTLWLNGGSIANSATIDIAGGAELMVGSTGTGTITLGDTQTLKGSGTVRGYVTASNLSTLAPGDSPGKLKIVGNVRMNSGATYEWACGSSTADLVDITGNLRLDSGWKVTLVDAGGAPAFEDVFNLFKFTGSWDPAGTAAGVISVGGTGWNIDGAQVLLDTSVPGAGRVYITGIVSTVPGDTNGDKVVDAADYIAVKQNLGMTSGATLLQGDVNEDGAVNWADLQIVMTNFGAGSGTAPATTPEPATLGLLAIGALAVLRRRQGYGGQVRRRRARA